MKIGGFVRSSLVDYPGKVAAVIFTQGCNFRCPYCHNPQLVYPEFFTEPVPFEYVWEFLGERRGLLEGVVFSGGEPTLQDDLPEVIRKVRSLGYAVKLDTNGSNPDVLAEVLPHLDYIAMDIKAPFGDAYARVCGVTMDDYEIRRSMLLIRATGLSYAFRTTFHSEFMPIEEKDKIKKHLGRHEIYVIQEANEKISNNAQSLNG
ncbi:MAG: anaerobic ribonucleoside-triphosphate reductase activating protein [Candidatus Omnitrophica bacterium]|nr:anaerobic ribonucleoside-triphosphate reductase activating protein [Candidatus Omnitrophota bacterium]